MGAKRTVETEAFGAMVRRMLAAYGRRVADGDMSDLAQLAELRESLDGLISTAIAHHVHDGRSWAEVGDAVGMARQHAHRKWAHEVGALIERGW